MVLDHGDDRRPCRHDRGARIGAVQDCQSARSDSAPINAVIDTRGFETLDRNPYFCNYRNIMLTSSKKNAEQVAKYADMFSAMGTEPRLRIMQLLLAAHPDGLVVGDIQAELDIPNSTLSHHLDKLKNEDLVLVRRESTFLHYTANADALQAVLQFLYAECCTRNKAVRPQDVVQICK
jgi:DNA-binding transcriptional ArsR family regulator